MPTTPKCPSFVVISDLHAHPWAAFSRGDGAKNTRLQRTLQVLDASLSKAAELKVPWLFTGDIIHTAGYALNVVSAALTEVFQSYGPILKLAVWGQHDARGIGGKITLDQTIWAALERAIEGLIVLDPSRPLNGGVVKRPSHSPLLFSGAGAQPHLDLFEYAESKTDVGLYHGTVRGSVGPNGYVFQHGLDPQQMLKRHRIAVVGDIHHAQQIEAPEGQAILVPGSPEHHNFGDKGEHGWWIVTVPHDPKINPEVEFVPGGSPEFRTVATPAQVHDDGHYYRVESMPMGAAAPENARVIAPAPTTVERRDLLRGAFGDQILAAWIREEPPSKAWLSAAPPDALRQLFETGKQLLVVQEVGRMRALRLTRLVLHNYCSYEDQEFEVQAGLWLVMGQGRDYPSNGAGKSSLFEALYWLLFGRTTKGLTGDEVIRWGTDECWVQGRFLAPDNEELRVTRSRGERSTLVVEETNADGEWMSWEATSVNDMADKLAAYLGLTPELFQALAYFSQEQLLLFAAASDGERKEMLGDLIGLAAYQAASALAEAQVREQEAVVVRQTALQEAAKTQAEREWTHLSTITANAEAWTTQHQQQMQQAQDQLVQFDEGRPETYARLLHDATRELEKGFLAREELLRARLANVTTNLQHAPPFTTALVEVMAVETRLLAQLDVAKRDVAMAKGVMEAETVRRTELLGMLERQEQTLAKGQCPVCLQPVSPQHRDQCLAPTRAALAETNARLANASLEQAHALEQAVQLRRQTDEARETVRQTREALELQARAAEIMADQEALAKERASVDVTARRHVDYVLQEKRAEIEQHIAHITREKNPYAGDEASTRRRIAEASRDTETYRDAVDAARMQQAMFTYWRTGFSKQGIQSLLVDEVAGLFNAARGIIFPALTQGVYDVQFSTRSQTKSGEWREKSEFQVFEHGVPVPYAALSGGQRRRIDVGVMLTLVKAVAEWMQVPGVLGLLVLDEVFGFLDASGAEGLAEALREVQQQIPSIYVVTHDQQLQALFEHLVIVQQDTEGVSHLIEGAHGDGDERERQRGPREDHAAVVRRKTGNRTDGDHRPVRRAPPRAKPQSDRTGMDRDTHRDGLLGMAHEDGD